MGRMLISILNLQVPGSHPDAGEIVTRRWLLRTANSKLLLDSSQSPECFLEQFPVGGTPSLEATASRSRARSSVVIPCEASAMSDRSPAVLVGLRTTSESVPSSTSGCWSPDVCSDDIGSSRSSLGSGLVVTAFLVHRNARNANKSSGKQRRLHMAAVSSSSAIALGLQREIAIRQRLDRVEPSSRRLMGTLMRPAVSLIASDTSIKAALEPVELFESICKGGCDIGSRFAVQTLCLD
jgi:hypothetical protein